MDLQPAAHKQAELDQQSRFRSQTCLTKEKSSSMSLSNSLIFRTVIWSTSWLKMLTKVRRIRVQSKSSKPRLLRKWSNKKSTTERVSRQPLQLQPSSLNTTQSTTLKSSRKRKKARSKALSPNLTDSSRILISSKMMPSETLTPRLR